jgi:hypothetical protein
LPQRDARVSASLVTGVECILFQPIFICHAARRTAGEAESGAGKDEAWANAPSDDGFLVPEKGPPLVVNEGRPLKRSYRNARKEASPDHRPAVQNSRFQS